MRAAHRCKDVELLTLGDDDHDMYVGGDPPRGDPQPGGVYPSVQFVHGGPSVWPLGYVDQYSTCVIVASATGLCEHG